MLSTRSTRLSIVLCKLPTIAAVYLLDYILSEVAKLSKTQQTKKLEIINCCMYLVLLTPVLWPLDDAILPAANCVLGLIDLKDEIEEDTGLKFFTPDITFAKKTVDVKNNTASWLAPKI